MKGRDEGVHKRYLKEAEWEGSNKFLGLPIHQRGMRRHGPAPECEYLDLGPVHNTVTPSPGDPLPNKKADSSLVRTVTRKTEYCGSSFHKRAASNLHTWDQPGFGHQVPVSYNRGYSTFWEAASARLPTASPPSTQ